MSERLKKKMIIVTYEARKKADQKDKEQSVFFVANAADDGKRKWRKQCELRSSQPADRCGLKVYPLKNFQILFH